MQIRANSRNCDQFPNGNSRILVAATTNVAFQEFRLKLQSREMKKRIGGAANALTGSPNGTTKLENCIVFQSNVHTSSAFTWTNIYIASGTVLFINDSFSAHPRYTHFRAEKGRSWGFCVKQKMHIPYFIYRQQNMNKSNNARVKDFYVI